MTPRAAKRRRSNGARNHLHQTPRQGNARYVRISVPVLPKDAARAEIERLRMAVGLATTLAGDVVMDAEHPLEMMQEIVAKVTAAREKALRPGRLHRGQR